MPSDHAKGLCHAKMWRVTAVGSTTSKTSSVDVGMCLDVHGVSCSAAGEKLMIFREVGGGVNAVRSSGHYRDSRYSFLCVMETRGGF